MEKETQWEQTEIPIDTFGSFTEMDIEIMEKDELETRKKYVERWIGEFEDELDLINTYLEK